MSNVDIISIDYMEKKVIFSINPIVNLILHVQCCIDPTLPSRNVYSEKLGDRLLIRERQFFEENFSLEQTGKVSSTAHFALLFQIPAYFSSNDIESLRKTVEVMKRGSLEELKKNFPEKGKYLDAYMPENLQMITYDRPLKSTNAETIDTYGRILENIYDRYYRDHWETIVSELNKRREILRGKIPDDVDLIRKWEEKTRIEFPYPEFVVELAEPINTLGTSLIAERGAFSPWVQADRIITLVSHEVGTHTLFQEKTLSSPGLSEAFEKNPERLIRTIEGLSTMTNMEILDEEGIPISYTKKFKEIFTLEMEALEKNWDTWRSDKISTMDLILRAYLS